MDEWELEVFRFTDDPDVSASINRHFAGTEISAGQETRIDERSAGRVEFGEPSVVGELRQGGDTRVGGYGVVGIRAEAGEDSLAGAVHDDGYALEAVADKRGVNEARAIRGHFADEWRGIRKLSRDSGLKYARSDRPERAGVTVDISVAGGVKSDGLRADRTSAAVLWRGIPDEGTVTQRSRGKEFGEKDQRIPSPRSVVLDSMQRAGSYRKICV